MSSLTFSNRPMTLRECALNARFSSGLLAGQPDFDVMIELLARRAVEGTLESRLEAVSNLAGDDIRVAFEACAAGVTESLALSNLGKMLQTK